MTWQQRWLGLWLVSTLFLSAPLIEPARAQTGTVQPVTAAAPGPAAAWTVDDVLRGSGRVLLGQLFIWSASTKIANYAGTAARMTAYSLPAAELLLIPTIALQLGGGLALAFNWHADWAAAALAAFVVPTSLVFHNFWAIANPAIAMQQQISFLKNVAILGGLLTVVGQGEGKNP